MRIKSFHVTYGFTEILKKGRDLFYHSDIRPGPSLRHFIPEEAIRIRPTEKQWQSLIEKIKPFAAAWKKEYDAGYDDGIQWEVKIIIDDLGFKSKGSNDFPEDFEQFRKIISELTGIDNF